MDGIPVDLTREFRRQRVSLPQGTIGVTKRLDSCAHVPRDVVENCPWRVGGGHYGLGRRGGHAPAPVREQVIPRDLHSRARTLTPNTESVRRHRDDVGQAADQNLTPS